MKKALMSLQGFRALGDGALDHIAPFVSARIVRAGETVFCQGEPSPYCFGVLSGEVMIQKISEESRLPPQVLGVIGPGRLFGESSLFEGKPRAAMATVSKDGKLVVIQGSKLRDWIQDNQETAKPLLSVLLDTSLPTISR
jgi:CRP-like cAMP-binding protein